MASPPTRAVRRNLGSLRKASERISLMGSTSGEGMTGIRGVVAGGLDILGR